MTNYWVEPEDLTAEWIKLRQTFQTQAKGNGGCQIAFSVIANNGKCISILEAISQRWEPKSIQLQSNHDWWSVIRRMRSVTPNGRLAIISINVLLDNKESPILWTEPKVLTILPT